MRHVATVQHPTCGLASAEGYLDHRHRQDIDRVAQRRRRRVSLVAKGVHNCFVGTSRPVYPGRSNAAGVGPGAIRGDEVWEAIRSVPVPGRLCLPRAGRHIGKARTLVRFPHSENCRKAVKPAQTNSHMPVSAAPQWSWSAQERPPSSVTCIVSLTSTAWSMPGNYARRMRRSHRRDDGDREPDTHGHETADMRWTYRFLALMCIAAAATLLASR